MQDQSRTLYLSLVTVKLFTEIQITHYFLLSFYMTGTATAALILDVLLLSSTLHRVVSTIVIFVIASPRGEGRGDVLPVRVAEH